MNARDTSANSITRRNFMKKSALTVGAITLLGQGIGLAAGSGSGSGSWGIICGDPTFENSTVSVVKGPFVSPQKAGNPYGDFEHFFIQVEIDSNKIKDSPGTAAYDECNLNYTATITVLVEGNPYLDHFRDRTVTADSRGGNPSWKTDYDSWDGNPKTMDPFFVGRDALSSIRVTVRANNGIGYGLFVKGDFLSPVAGSLTAFSEFYVSYPHRFNPKRK